MSPAVPTDFALRIIQLRLGDPVAIENFVAEYEPYIRRSIRFRINQSALWTVTDSTDVCQSVLGGFLLRLTSGDFDLRSEDDMRRLLLVIAKRKFSMLRRHEYSAKRSRKVTRSLHDLPEIVSAASQEPSARFECRELAELVKLHLTESEFDLLRRRRDGQAWDQIASDLAVDVVTLRKRLSRALQRVAAELDLEY